jgi:hypothetical protein
MKHTGSSYYYFGKKVAIFKPAVQAPLKPNNEGKLVKYLHKILMQS